MNIKRNIIYQYFHGACVDCCGAQMGSQMLSVEPGFLRQVRREKLLRQCHDSGIREETSATVEVIFHEV